ncbi:hypothetical protein TRFO_06615 [Tritrichomonas foetus]|uniref:Sec1 family protein n=1 Tax=Tritrichomonas foetus TaxID=1144522 RepID=A0A1J4K203_9EUKA|nr:hypothetical protein TRFO_06615 [Tritrichomonas foetus]|eukprot:OHT03766.1 hypothetical protein TRFO_06615 [Tritrichomonas foetus]
MFHTHVQKAAFSILREQLSGPNSEANKILLFDHETINFLVPLISKQELLTFGYVLKNDISRFKNSAIRDPGVKSIIKSMNCYCFLRLTQENLEHLKILLSESICKSYFLYFTNSIPNNFIEELAESDRHCLIIEMKEVFVDFSALGSIYFSFGLSNLDSMINATNYEVKNLIYGRITDSLYSVLCSLNFKPYIRYDACSNHAKIIADKLNHAISHNHDQGSYTEICNVLILDRKSDVMTPLRHFPEFFPLIHDLLRIENNFVNISNAEKTLKKSQNTCYELNEMNDPLLPRHRFSNISELGEELSVYINKIKNGKTTKQNDNKTSTPNTEETDSINAILQYLETFDVLDDEKEKSEYNKKFQILNVIINQISPALKLTDFIRKESSMLKLKSENEDYDAVIDAIYSIDNDNQRNHVLRLATIFSLLYNHTATGANHVELIKKALTQHGFTQGDFNFTLIDKVLQINEEYSSSYKNVVKKNIPDFRSNGSQPRLALILEHASKNKLSEVQFPFAGKKGNSKYWIVFYVGGATYQEVNCATNIKNINIIIGGTTFHNADSFLKEEVLTSRLNH